MAGEPFDLVVLDMILPGTDGLALADAIRAHRTSIELPMIMLSSEDQVRHAPDLVAASALKPVPAPALLAMVRRVLRHRGLSETPVHGLPSLQATSAAPTPTLRILLAEDEPDNQTLALELLRQLGYHAEVASDGAEVLDRLRRHRFDLVLMDVMMPQVDGLEATRRLRRELPVDRQPHVIALTARALRSDREACLAAGMDGYLAKPVRLEDLASALSRASAAA